MLENYFDIKKQIEDLDEAEKVTLICVTKSISAEEIIPIIEAGQKDFAENKVQEAETKWASIKEKYPDIRLHLIGNLQKNKAKKALQIFDFIHTIDSLPLAIELKNLEEKLGVKRKYFIQINTGNEPQKHGVSIGLASKLIDEILALRLNILGLMCIPTINTDPTPQFLLLKDLAQEYRLKNLSMGMSQDFDKAIKCGATHVRIGSKIFQKRK